MRPSKLTGVVAAAAACTAVVLGGPLLTVTSASAATTGAAATTANSVTTSSTTTSSTTPAGAATPSPATPSPAATTAPTAAASAPATAVPAAPAPASADATPAPSASATGTSDPSLAEMNATGNHTMGSTIAAHSGSDGSSASGGLMHANSANSSAVPGTDGFDISAWQTNSSINWSSAYSKGARFVYIKASESTTYTSSQFGAQWTGATNAGIVRGAYHFAVPNKSSGATQASYFVAHGGGWSADGRTLPPLLDIEYDPYTGTDGTNSCYGLSKSAMVSWISDFSNTVLAKTGIRPAIYSTTDWWSTCTGNSGAFSASPLFIARYPSNLASGAGTLPASWSRYSMWQYADSGVFPGDQDVFNGSTADLRTYATNGGAATSTPSVSTVGTALSSGAKLTGGQGITSPNKQYTLTQQLDGNLVVYGNGRAVWSSGTSGKPGAYATMQPDGNFVVYLGTQALWSSGTSGRGATSVGLTNDGDLQVTGGSTTYWHDGRPGSNSAVPVTTFAAGQYLLSPNGTKQLVQQADGNLVLYSNGRATWSSRSSGNAGATTKFQSDGNLVVYLASGGATWASGTSGRAANQLTVQDDGNVVLYRSGTAIWSTGTQGR